MSDVATMDARTRWIAIGSLHVSQPYGSLRASQGLSGLDLDTTAVTVTSVASSASLASIDSRLETPGREKANIAVKMTAEAADEACSKTDRRNGTECAIASVLSTPK